MNALPERDSFELEVTNFGPIVKANIDLRPLTVFVGPSNTGKSWLAILIYALHRYFSGSFSGDRWSANVEWITDDDGLRKLPSETIGHLVEWWERTFSDWSESSDERDIVLRGPVADVLRSVFDVQASQLADDLVRCFGLDDIGGLIRKGKNDGARISFGTRSPSGSVPLWHELELEEQGVGFKSAVPEDLSMRIKLEDHRDFKFSLEHFRRMHALAEDSTNRDTHLALLVESLAAFVVPHIFGPLNLRAFYLPADRTGVMHTYRTVTSNLISRAPKGRARRVTGRPMLTGYLADFLQRLIELDRSSNGPSTHIRKIGKQMEDAILRGSVHVENSELIGFPEFAYKPTGWKDPLPLMNASSMVSEIAPVVLHLRHIVGVGDVLIIEEPESHLHPAMQVELVRQLVALVRSGVRVIATTHSEWILEELANAVQRSSLSESHRMDATGTNTALDAREVGVWLFKPKKRPKGSVVQEVKIDEETGLYPSDYDAVSEALYNDSASIFNRVHGSQGV